MGKIVIEIDEEKLYRKGFTREQITRFLENVVSSNEDPVAVICVDEYSCRAVDDAVIIEFIRSVIG